MSNILKRLLEAREFTERSMVPNREFWDNGKRWNAKTLWLLNDVENSVAWSIQEEIYDGVLYSWYYHETDGRVLASMCIRLSDYQALD